MGSISAKTGAIADIGRKITSSTLEAGGFGIIGWLSSIRVILSNLTVTITGAVATQLKNADGATAQLPDSTALSDALANPTTTRIGAQMLGWDGTQGVRARLASAAEAFSAASLLGVSKVVHVLWTSAGNGAPWASASSSADASSALNAAWVGLSIFNGTTWDRRRAPNVFKVVALAAATAEATIWTPASGKKFRLMGFILTPGAASTLTFKDNTGGTTIFAVRGSTDQAISPREMGNGILSATANNVLTVTRGTSATLDGVVWGTEE